MNRNLKLLGVISTIFMVWVLLQGALVTNTGSGRGCGDSWPLCDGNWIPYLTLESIIEYTHRAVSGIAGLLVVALAYWGWRALGKSREATALAVGSVFFIVVQALLGAAAVMWPQPKTVMALHFGISLVSFAFVYLLTVRIFQADQPQRAPQAPPSASFQRRALVAFVYTYVVVYLGAYVRHTGASLACTDWPLCNGALIPELTGPVGANFLHRAAAALLILLLGWFAWQARGERPDLARSAQIAFGLVLLQALSGAMVVLGQLSLGAQTLHGMLMIALFASLSYALWQTLFVAPPEAMQR